MTDDDIALACYFSGQDASWLAYHALSGAVYVPQPPVEPVAVSASGMPGRPPNPGMRNVEPPVGANEAAAKVTFCMVVTKDNRVAIGQSDDPGKNEARRQAKAEALGKLAA